jgi:hypothetical protein
VIPERNGVGERANTPERNSEDERAMDAERNIHSERAETGDRNASKSEPSQRQKQSPRAFNSTGDAEMPDEVTREKKIESLEDMMDVNARAMEDVARDTTLSPMDRIRGLNIGVRTQTMLSADQRARVTLLAKLGMKAKDHTRSLPFYPSREE